ncbi:MAG: carboxy terminal-processing peptidase [Burkholderiales bacterium]
MKRNVVFLLFAFATAALGATLDAGTSPPPALAPLQQQALAARTAADVLTRFHYKAMPLDDSLSAKIFDQYLKTLDGERLFFIQEDIDQLGAYRTRLDNAILEENLAAPFAIFNLYTRRATERFAYARGLLRQGFEFRSNEIHRVSRAKEPWAKTEAEIREIWRKRVKNDWLRLKLAGSDDKSIVTTLDKRYENALKRVGQMKSEDAFQTFMNAYTMAIEPHTNYMGPRASQEFDISMKLSLVGIGAVLAESNDYITIRDVLPGGPAALSGQLKIGDRIVGVGQGRDAVATDILGWRVDDAVTLIRGAEDTVVVLEVLAANAPLEAKSRRITLVRKKVNLEEQAAKKSILTVTDAATVRRIGVITLPSFYEDFEGRRRGEPGFKSASGDVARLLEELKKEKVDSVLLDLRNNGGGSLTGAIELTGLFIDRGPVLQQRLANGRITVQNDDQAGVAWDGPLGVLINRGSASASEIFAAAIQDYGRGVVIGESSFGKGTVQSVIDLDRNASSDRPSLGGLRLTIAQFFRINGGTTQLRGVTPDIVFPAVLDAANFGESSFDNALPWMQIRSTSYPTSAALREDLPILLDRHAARRKIDRDFQYLQEDIEELRRQQTANQVSLNEAERRKEQRVRETRIAARETSNGVRATSAAKSAAKGGSSRDDGLQPGERNLVDELAAEKERKNARDFFLLEAAQILGDQVGLPSARTAFNPQSRAAKPL